MAAETNPHLSAQTGWASRALFDYRAGLLYFKVNFSASVTVQTNYFGYYLSADVTLSSDQSFAF